MDISTYTDQSAPIRRINRRVGILMSIVLSMVLARIINGLMVFQEEEGQTIVIIQEIMAYGFLFSGLMALVFISFLVPVNYFLDGIHRLKKSAYNSGLLCILSGVIFMAICILKYLFLAYLPNAFDVFIQFGPVTVYVLQGSFYFALTFCIGIFFNRILALKNYLKLYFNSRD